MLVFIEERHAAILELLCECGSITTAQIQKKFGISYDSAKRDLRLLEEQGKLRRTHGGAIPVGQLAIGKPRGTTAHISDTVKSDSTVIAAYAASLVREDEVIFLPSDTLGELVAKELPRGMRLRVVTGSVIVAELLRHREGITVMLVGGQMDGQGSCYDSFACDMVRRLRFDKAFITSDAISSTFGISVKLFEASAFLNAVMGSSRKVIGMYTSEKLGCDSDVSVCPASRLDVILTYGGVTDETRTALEECGVSMVLCG